MRWSSAPKGFLRSKGVASWRRMCSRCMGSMCIPRAAAQTRTVSGVMLEPSQRSRSNGISNTWFACGFPSSSFTWPANQSGGSCRACPTRRNMRGPGLRGRFLVSLFLMRGPVSRYSLKALVRVGQLERPCRLFGHAECRDLFCLPGNLRRLWLSCLSSLSSQTTTRPGRSWRIHRPARRWGGRLRKRRRDLVGGLPPLTEGKDYAAPGSADYSQELGG